MQIILENGDVQTGSVRTSHQFKDYLKEQGISETSEVVSGLPVYKVGTNIAKEQASSRLCDIVGDMMCVFDVDPTPVIPRGDKRLEFANQLGVFYIDNIVANK